MQITKKDWLSYIDKLAKLNKEASDLMVQYVQQNGFSNRRELINYAYGLVNKYGNGSAALAAAMYDAVAEASGMWLEPAEMPDLISEDEVAKTVNGTLKRSKNVNELGGAVSRLVKRQSADTMLNNAYRDRKGGRKYGKKRNTGAQVAWIPFGDTCPFCLMLASNGWRNQTVGGANHHAEHIHSNCDCNYAVRFDSFSGVEGYNPDTYVEMFEDVEGDTWDEKVNAMRRQQYEHNKDEINAQKRAAYAERVENNNIDSAKKSLLKLSKDGNTYVPKITKLYENARKIPPYKDYTDIVSHGDPYSICFTNADGVESNVNAEDFAKIIEKGGFYKGGKIRLVACNTGEEPAIVPQYLADYFNVEVLAPTEAVYVDNNGKIVVANDEKDAIMGIDTGFWKPFYPKER